MGLGHQREHHFDLFDFAYIDFLPFGYHKSQRHNPMIAHFSHAVAHVLIILRSGSCLHSQVFVHLASLVHKLVDILGLQRGGRLVKIDDHVLKALHYALDFLPLL
jgi:hypothetical protein